jgi:aspartyl-tRNA(Asn)/glutamyl-tRNA(Gln) amidotransferase subunit A
VTHVPTLSSLAHELNSGKTTSRALVEKCLERIADPAGEGARAFVKVHADQARLSADAIDHLRKHNYCASPFAGIPISIKDVFDCAGDVTTAGSRVLSDAAPAVEDAASVAALRHAGFVIMGRTHMTEFAFSGIGLNPHYDTPSSIWQRDQQRIPGGSSSGAAISVADGMAHAALGTDTGGSCRIPAAFNALVGYKPTAARISRRGAFPLSTSLDSIGPLARSVTCCAQIDAILAGDDQRIVHPRALAHARIAVPRTIVFDQMDDHVGAMFERALKILRDGGAAISHIDVPEFTEIGQINAKGGFGAAESYHHHRALIEKGASLYDPRVISRILRGREQSAADYIELVLRRAEVIASYQARMESFDFCLYPSVPIIAPLKSEFERDDDYARLNLLLLRNPAFINMLDGCAISVPAHSAGTAPVGLMLSKAGGQDHALFDWALAVETALAAS